MDRALRVFLVEVKKKKLGASTRRRNKTEAAGSTPSSEEEGRRIRRAETPRKGKREAKRSDNPSRSRTIPAAVRRAVYERDGGRCTFTNRRGTRCTAVCGLEFHHDMPFGIGGEHDVENIRLLCNPHNRHQARKDYGAEWIEERIRETDRPRDQEGVQITRVARTVARPSPLRSEQGDFHHSALPLRSLTEPSPRSERRSGVVEAGGP